MVPAPMQPLHVAISSASHRRAFMPLAPYAGGAVQARRLAQVNSVGRRWSPSRQDQSAITGAAVGLGGRRLGEGAQSSELVSCLAICSASTLTCSKDGITPAAAVSCRSARSHASMS